MRKRQALTRSLTDRVLAGICGGLAAYTGINSLWLRTIFVALASTTLGYGILLYLILWLTMRVETRDDLLPLSASPPDSATVPTARGLFVLGVATILTGIGLFVLSTGLLPFAASELFWPVAALTAGGALLWRQVRGVIQEQRKNLLWPSLLLGLGVLLLLQVLGIMPAYLWDLLARLWPLLLIILGLTALVADRRASVNALMFTGVVALVIVIFAAGYTRRALQPATDNQTTIDLDLEDASDISLRLDLSLTELVIDIQESGDAPGRITGTFTGSTENTLTENYTLKGTQGQVVLTESTLNPIPKLEAFGSNRLELHLPSDVPLKQLVAQSEAGSMVIDLTGLDLRLSEKLKLETNLGDISLTLPDETTMVGDLIAPYGDVRLRYPFGMPMRLRINSGLVGTKTIPKELEQLAAGPWETKGFLDEDFHVSLNLSTQFGAIIVEYSN